MARSSATLTIQDCLTCFICGNIFRKPRILQCGHTFCGECLGKLKNDLLRDGTLSKCDLVSDVYADSTDTVDVSLSSSYYADTASNSLTNQDTGSNCYRPLSSSRNQSRAMAEATNGIPRSNTFVREKQPSCSEQSHSRNSAPANIGSAYNNVCSKCGTASPATLPRSRKSSQSPSPTLKPKDTQASPRWNTSPKRSTESVCSFEQKHGKEMELFVCPIPECNYALRVMNLARWSPKNIIVADISSVWRKLQENRKDVSTQTDISNEKSLLVTIPRSLVDSQPLVPLGQRRRHSSLMDMAMQSTASLEGVSRGYLPSGSATWRSYAAMLGMNILHQIVQL
ncbi:E3 ubiquitin-protein ligase rnf114 [Biomphalaria glabrata]|uniref:Uncharacterized protein LOC129921656 n=1 Tax=Biomphalaria glabrata TaxID=6526 RepID=A0A9W2YAF0_BIOGL|nr:uncharacterized protein LOC129921656 [Biomphalaria glabrata]XP_055859831.1 uncharacterized protein LOC129921656 [Biomphalaria glabrata]KAI8769294.1 CAunnamed protein product [Biomphalaria glabrata]KAI8789607.1 CAunnamed protein product [Biomphalaria glabrata]